MLKAQPTNSTAQTELPFAIVEGEVISTPPEDLYIPPEALEVFLESFEGPLDLLLYLIKRQNIDILNIPIARITEQYMQYVELMKNINLDLAAEYLVMAAMLAEIKARMLLPRHEELEDEEDPRSELIRRLQEYERFKQAASDLDDLPRMDRDTFATLVTVKIDKKDKPLPEVQLSELLNAFKEILKRVDMSSDHQIKRENLSIREKMTHVLSELQGEEFILFYDLFKVEEGRQGVVVTFIAMLELLKMHLIDIVQAESYAPIYLRPAESATVH